MTGVPKPSPVSPEVITYGYARKEVPIVPAAEEGSLEALLAAIAHLIEVKGQGAGDPACQRAIRAYDRYMQRQYVERQKRLQSIAEHSALGKTPCGREAEAGCPLAGYVKAY